MNYAFLSAYRKGLAAGRTNQQQKNPYADNATFSTAFHRYWKLGYTHGRAGCDCQNPWPDTKYRIKSVWHVSLACPIHGEQS
jgi:hypothetical protein